jgi:ribose transport system permease protein
MSANKLKLGSAGSFESRWLTTLYRLLTMGVWGALAIAFVPQFASYSNVLNLVRDIFLLCLMGYGVALSMLIGGLDLSIGSVAALSSVLGATIIAGGNPFVGSLTTLVVGAAIGALNGVLIAYLKLPDFIVTFSMMYIVRGLALTYTQGQSIYNLPPSFTWIGKGFLGPVPVPVVISIVILGHLVVCAGSDNLWRGIYAVGSSHRAALYTGSRYRESSYKSM